MKFNMELSEWLLGQQMLFECQSTQKDIFSMIRNKEIFDLLHDEQKELIVKILESTLSLSFILKNNEKEINKLIKFLE